MRLRVIAEIIPGRARVPEVVQKCIEFRTSFGHERGTVAWIDDPTLSRCGRCLRNDGSVSLRPVQEGELLESFHRLHVPRVDVENPGVDGSGVPLGVLSAQAGRETHIRRNEEIPVIKGQREFRSLMMEHHGVRSELQQAVDNLYSLGDPPGILERHPWVTCKKQLY